MPVHPKPRFRRVAELTRVAIGLTIDGAPVEAAQGDTLMVAILANADSMRDSEFDEGRRAGFCLMGACQDCWVWLEDGTRVRACTTDAAAGMAVLTRAKESGWVSTAL
jgi:aerobic-type carbon monoxide dehydrogenase small subunit (CoxS/CutS family)